jgi:hypothetical protein
VSGISAQRVPGAMPASGRPLGLVIDETAYPTLPFLHRLPPFVPCRRLDGSIVARAYESALRPASRVQRLRRLHADHRPPWRAVRTPPSPSVVGPLGVEFHHCRGAGLVPTLLEPAPASSIQLEKGLRCGEHRDTGSPHRAATVRGVACARPPTSTPPAPASLSRGRHREYGFGAHRGSRGVLRLSCAQHPP